MLLVLVQEADRLEQAPLVRRGEADERLDEGQREVEGAWPPGYVRFRGTGWRRRRGRLPVATVLSSSS